MKEYKNLEEYQKDLQENKQVYDSVKIGEIVYTQDSYDMRGKEISYGNKRLEKAFIIVTENRYIYGMKDAIIEEFEPICFRNDINYLE